MHNTYVQLGGEFFPVIPVHKRDGLYRMAIIMRDAWYADKDKTVRRANQFFEKYDNNFREVRHDD